MPESKANTRRQKVYLSPTPTPNPNGNGSLFLHGEESFPDDDEEEGEEEVSYLAFRQRYWEAIVAVIHRCHLSDLAYLEEWGS